MPNRKVLVVEDEESIFGFMENMLKAEGCQVFTAPDAETAWTIFQKERPQAVSVDLHLGRSAMQGLGLLKKIREADQKVYLLIFTRITDDREIEKAKLYADAGFIKPPGSAEQLREMIELLAKGERKGASHG